MSSHTKKTYQAAVGRYLAWLCTTDDPEGALRANGWYDRAVDDYKQTLRRQGAAPSTINLAISAIRSLYRSIGVGPPYVEREPSHRIPPRTLTESEQLELLRAVEAVRSVRDQAILTTVLHTGLLRGDLAKLTLDDVVLKGDRGVLKVRRGSRGSNRELLINPTCRRALSNWIAQRAKLSAEKRLSTDALWVSRLGRPMSPKSLYTVVKRVGEAAGLDGISPLVLRNTLRVNLRASGTPLGTASVTTGDLPFTDTTRLYRVPSREEAAREVEAAFEDTVPDADTGSPDNLVEIRWGKGTPVTMVLAEDDGSTTTHTFDAADPSITINITGDADCTTYIQIRRR